MSITWVRYTVGTQQLRRTTYQDRECYCLSVAWDEPMAGKWGDTPEKPKKRAQLREPGNQAQATPYSLHFGTLIPSDWEYLAHPTCLFEVHAGDTPGKPLPFALYAINQELVFTSGFTDTWRVWAGIAVPEQWDDWVFEYLPSPGTDGWARLGRNGNRVWERENLQTMYPGDPGNYSKIGPYVAQGDGTQKLPRWRRLYVSGDFG